MREIDPQELAGRLAMLGRNDLAQAVLAVDAAFADPVRKLYVDAGMAALERMERDQGAGGAS